MSATIRKPGRFLRAGRLAGVLGACLLGALAGCGSADDPRAATSSSNAKLRKQHRSQSTAQPGEENLADMVAAVSAAKGPPVELRFALTARPEVGQVMDIDVALVPHAPVPESVSASFQAVDGLEIVAGAQIPRIETLADGVPIRHIVKILPKRDGIFALNAVVAFTSANQDSYRAFSIPLIAGEGLPEQVAKGP